MGKKSKFKGIPLTHGRTVILFGDDGKELDAPTGTRQQQRTEVRRRAKEMERVLREHDLEIIRATQAKLAAEKT